MIVDYEESILSHVSALRAYYGLDSSCRPDRKLMALLEEKRPQKIFLILIDAMGSKLIERKLPEESFLRRNMSWTATTVFPTTTTAATVSIQNGRTPAENGWLGWSQYLREVDDIVVPFLSKAYYGGKPYEPGIFSRYVPVANTVTELDEKGIKARILNPSFDPDGCESLEEMCERLKDYSHTDEYSYIYAYWDRYDSLMHMNGPDAGICDDYLKQIDKTLEKLSEEIAEDTLLVITADHGQIQVEREYDLYNSKYKKYFSRRPSLECRAMSLCINKGMEEEFEKEFKNDFEDDYILLSYDQVRTLKIYGDGPEHPRLKEFVGDYLAIAKGHMSFRYREYYRENIPGDHAGMCEDELMIPIITYMK